MTDADGMPPGARDGRDEAPADAPDVATASDEQRLRAGIEAILFLADEPVPVPVLADVLGADPATVEAEVTDLASAYEHDLAGLQLRRAAGGWRMYTAPIARDAIEAWAVSGRSGRLTQAALETLAVIAYKQPISRQAIGDVRGVNADGAVRSLVARGLVAEVARDPGPGQAVLYGTTTTFLERLGLDSLDDLPALTDFLQEMPAPDEPELGALREVRRRLAAGDEPEARRPGGGGTSSAGAAVPADEDDDVLPAPVRAPVSGGDDADMDELTDRLEAVARSAVGRLRSAVAAGGAEAERADAEVAEAPGDEAAGDEAAGGETAGGEPDRAADDQDGTTDPADGDDRG